MNKKRGVGKDKGKKINGAEIGERDEKGLVQ